MKIQCPNCAKSSHLSFQMHWKSFGCPHCRTLFVKNEAGELQQQKIYPQLNFFSGIGIGQQGVIEGSLWEVVNFSIKYVENEPYSWREYTLCNALGEIRYLSEYDGHWTWAKEIETGEKFSIESDADRRYNGEQYAIFNSSRFTTEYAAGFFDYPPIEKGQAKDFVRQPIGLLLEKADGESETYGYEARYLPAKEIKAAFPDFEPPEQLGVGMLQPFAFSLPDFWVIMASVGGIILFFQILIAGFYPEYQVLSDYVELPDSVASVTHVSRSFTTTGRVAPLEITLSAPVDNSWAAVEFNLVNEATKEERFGAVEVAYYHGREDGEEWSEGDAKPCIKICGVSPGTYHLVMEISKEPLKPEINTLKYTVSVQATTYGNLNWILVLLLVAGLGAFIAHGSFEKDRWLNSDFGPESADE